MGLVHALIEAVAAAVKSIVAVPGAVAGAVGGGGASYVALAVLGAGMLGTGATALWYVQTHRPLSEAPLVGRLPGVGTPGQQPAPTFQFAIYGLDKPVGVAISPGGDRLYVAESGGARAVRVFDRDGKELATFAPPGTSPNHRLPAHVAVGPDGRVYVSDLRRAQLDVYTPDGGYQGTVRPIGLEGGWQPLAMAFDQAGGLYVTDMSPGSHRVVALDPQGRVRAQFGRQGSGPGELSFPNGLAVDATGRVYVSDSNNSRIQVLDLGSGFVGSFRSPQGTNLPRGAAIQGNRLYISDTIGDHVSVFALEKAPRFLYAFGDEGRGDGRFLYPEDLAVDASGRIYVADRENNRIQVFGYS